MPGAASSMYTVIAWIMCLLKWPIHDSSASALLWERIALTRWSERYVDHAVELSPTVRVCELWTPPHDSHRLETGFESFDVTALPVCAGRPYGGRRGDVHSQRQTLCHRVQRDIKGPVGATRPQDRWAALHIMIRSIFCICRGVSSSRRAGTAECSTLLVMCVRLPRVQCRQHCESLLVCSFLRKAGRGSFAVSCTARDSIGRWSALTVFVYALRADFTSLSKLFPMLVRTARLVCGIASPRLQATASAD